MGAARKHTATRLGPAAGPVNEKPMPRGLTFHTPHIPFHGHYGVRPKAPWEPETPHHLNHNCQKEKMAGRIILPYQFDFLTRI